MKETYLSVEVTKTFEHLTVDELAEWLKRFGDDDYGCDWKISKDYDCDCDGYESFNGHYNLRLKIGVGCISNPEDLAKHMNWCYSNIVAKEES